MHCGTSVHHVLAGKSPKSPWDIIVPLPGFLQQGLQTTHADGKHVFEEGVCPGHTCVCFLERFQTKPPLHDCFGCHNKIPWPMVPTADTHFSQFWGQAQGVSGEKPFPPCSQLPPLKAPVVGRRKQGGGSLLSL